MRSINPEPGNLVHKGSQRGVGRNRPVLGNEPLIAKPRVDTPILGGWAKGRLSVKRFLGQMRRKKRIRERVKRQEGLAGFRNEKRDDDVSAVEDVGERSKRGRDSKVSKSTRASCHWIASD
uniref:Uncharacterized protein n=1 Tax=Coccidioides posadasii RMSCC 3488 TaxID=454284 RepID=A0A0J6F8T3_COCPO|nr:hypothetical protein CPAG_01725 [Coccidioides posadasii RMSCC 3488]